MDTELSGCGSPDDRHREQYQLFVWLIPVFFVLPLAIFSLYKGRALWQSTIEFPVTELLSALPELLHYDSFGNLFQAMTLLLFTILALAGFWLNQRMLMFSGYLVLISSGSIPWMLL